MLDRDDKVLNRNDNVLGRSDNVLGRNDRTSPPTKAATAKCS
jgi:hypothetical protein